MHFLLWTKWSHESTNFDTFKCSDENLPNSSCHFPNHKPVLPQILNNSSVSLKIALLYFFWSNVIYFEQKGQITVQIFENWVLRSKFTKFLSLLKQQIGFSSNFASFYQYHFIYFHQKEPIKVQIWWNSTWAPESLKFCTLMGFCCKNHTKF